MRYLVLLLLVSAAHAAEIVSGSISPDGKWQIVAEAGDDNARYRVANRTMDILRGAFPSDYWRPEQCLHSRVVWRPDSDYFVIEEAFSGIHQNFVVAHRTAHGFTTMSFDRGTVMKSTKLSWHHGVVRFDRWLPNDRLAVTIYGDLDISRADFECSFVLDLKDSLKIISHQIIKPK